jgi:hypothetical protein
MSQQRAKADRPELLLVPTLVQGRVLETDLELCSELAGRYRTTLLASTRAEPNLPDGTSLRDPMWLRPLLCERGPAARLLYLLRADAAEGPGPLAACLRYPGVVLHRGGSLLPAYRGLYLHRDDTPDFALELGRQLGADAPGVFGRALLGLPSRATEDRALLLRSVAEKSLAVVTGEPQAYAELEALAAPNRRLVRPAPYTLPPDAETPPRRGLRLTLFGERPLGRPLSLALACRRVLEPRGVEIEVLIAEPGAPSDLQLPEGARRVRPSERLLRESDVVLALPEGPRSWSSAALASCVRNGAVTVAPALDAEPRLRDAFVPLRSWPQCAEELCRAVEALARAPALRRALSNAARSAAELFPTRERLGLELFRSLELCQYLRPERPDPLGVWRDVMGTRNAELRSLGLRPPDPDLLDRHAEAARLLQARPGGEE